MISNLRRVSNITLPAQVLITINVAMSNPSTVYQHGMISQPHIVNQLSKEALGLLCQGTVTTSMITHLAGAVNSLVSGECGM